MGKKVISYVKKFVILFTLIAYIFPFLYSLVFNLKYIFSIKWTVTTKC